MTWQLANGLESHDPTEFVQLYLGAVTERRQHVAEVHVVVGVPVVIGPVVHARCEDLFRIYVEKVLVPRFAPGDIVIMDNLGSHKAKAVRQLIRAAGPSSSSCRDTRRT